MWKTTLTALAATMFAQGGSAACSTNMLLDNFSKWSNYTNSLGSAVSGEYTLIKEQF